MPRDIPIVVWKGVEMKTTVGEMLEAIGKIPKPNPVKKWNGHVPGKCDICKSKITTTFIDGKTQGGPWGILCQDCHRTRGCGLGTGKGQKYTKHQVTDEFIKTAG
jgi:hypothetical protein